jgi:hypothetical protein
MTRGRQASHSPDGRDTWITEARSTKNAKSHAAARAIILLALRNPPLPRRARQGLPNGLVIQMKADCQQ